MPDHMCHGLGTPNQFALGGLARAVALRPMAAFTWLAAEIAVRLALAAL
jgi:hypothetical protein